MKIKQGEIILLTDGEYSDYEVNTLCKATKDIDVMALRLEYLELFPKEVEPYSFKVSHFLKWLVVDKCVADEIKYI